MKHAIDTKIGNATPAARLSATNRAAASASAVSAVSRRRANTSAAPASRSIELHINELVLHGFSGVDRQPIVESIERELRALLIGEDFSTTHSFEIGRVAGSFQLDSGRRGESAGVKIARAIHAGLHG